MLIPEWALLIRTEWWYMEILFHLQCWLWHSIMMEISGDLCEWEKIQGNLLGDNTLSPSFFPSLATDWWGSPCVCEGEGLRCAHSPKSVVRATSPLCNGEGRRERGGKEQEVSLPSPLLPRFPPSPCFSPSARSLSSFSLSVSLDHTHSGILTSQLLTH